MENSPKELCKEAEKISKIQIISLKSVKMQRRVQGSLRDLLSLDSINAVKKKNNKPRDLMKFQNSLVNT